MPDIAAQPLAVAPTFTIETTHGPVSLADYRGNSVPDNSGSGGSWHGKRKSQEIHVRLHPAG